MTNLQRLYDEQGQSPWLDNLTRTYLRDGTLARFVHDGIRGVTANPTIFAKAIEGSDAYDEQFAALIAGGTSIIDAYWDLVIDDVRGGSRSCDRRSIPAAVSTGTCQSKWPPNWPTTPTAPSPRPVIFTPASTLQTCS